MWTLIIAGVSLDGLDATDQKTRRYAGVVRLPQKKGRQDKDINQPEYSMQNSLPGVNVDHLHLKAGRSTIDID